jgi:hypothetical protein
LRTISPALRHTDDPVKSSSANSSRDYTISTCRISGLEIVDDVVPGWLLENECVPTRTIHDIVRRR